MNGTTILKSGSDFHQFSKIVIDFREDPIEVETEKIDVSKEYEPDVELSKHLEEYSGKSSKSCIVDFIIVLFVCRHRRKQDGRGSREAWL